MGVKITERDLGYAKMRKGLGGLSGSYTKVGVQEGAKASDGVADLVLIAAANEFGTADGHVPERSFLRSTFDENRDKLHDVIQAEAEAVMTKGKDPAQSLGQIGAYHAGQVQAKIHSHPPPPNAPSTIEAKGSSGTLVDSGQLVQSITHVEVMGGKK